ncbi:MAG: hydrogenase nickel incorporation protein HypB [Caldiserica bacterium]|nr:hydrogenase nickel incorporation protein HypB [Caldisericota bacterium]
MKIKVLKPILEANESIADEVKGILREKGIKLVNIIGSPGSGKTALLEKTLAHLFPAEVGIIEGDISTTYDAERVYSLGAEVVQINTQGACHLDANMIKEALQNLTLDNKKIIFIENVGNLVCPAEFRLGEDLRIIVLSLTEGEHKPLKYPYPLSFSSSQVLIVNKIDLLPHLKVDMEGIIAEAKKINPDLKVFPLSSLTGEGFSGWIEYIKNLFCIP